MEIEVRENYPVKNLTAFKIGGKVDKLYFPATQQEFIYLLNTLDSPLIFGSWSNVLVSSNGIKTAAISTAKLNSIVIKGKRVFADCGVKGPKLSQMAMESELSGFEFMIGFPGSIGGNIYMNASAHAQSISDTIVSACVYDLKNKEVINLDKNDLKFGYRTSILQNKPYVLLSAEFDLKKSSKAQVEGLMNRNLEFRKTHQPSLAIPNCGSTFKNPENDSAGRLLDKAGAKEFTVGGAKVWENHANFIVNASNATSTDVLELMFKMYEEVKTKYTIDLSPEIRYVGEKSQREEELCNIMYKQN